MTFVNAFGTNRFNDTELEPFIVEDLYVNETGDAMTGILNMKNNQIKNLSIPIEQQDAVSKSYVDLKDQKAKAYVDNNFVSRAQLDH